MSACGQVTLCGNAKSLVFLILFLCSNFVRRDSVKYGGLSCFFFSESISVIVERELGGKNLSSELIVFIHLVTSSFIIRSCRWR